MSGTVQETLSAELRSDACRLDNACRRYFGVTARMFRSVKFLFYIATLVFTGYLIESAAVDPFIGMVFAALLITGPEGVESFLIAKGQLPNREKQNDD